MIFLNFDCVKFPFFYLKFLYSFRFVVSPTPDVGEDASVPDDTPVEVTTRDDKEECEVDFPTPPPISKPKALPNTWKEPLSHHMTIGPHASFDWVLF